MYSIKTLSLCGGGTSGYITAYILDKIEKETNSKIYEHFDMISGVSTGSIIGMLISIGISAEDIKQYYKKFYKDVFGVKKTYIKLLFSSLYDNKNLNNALGDLVGDMKLNEVKCNFMCHALKLNEPTLELKFWKSWKEEDKDFLLRDIVTASSCAPFAFQPFKINEMYYYDGGLVINEPSVSLFSEASKMYGFGNIEVLSFQTDRHKGFKKPKNIKGLFGLTPKLTQLSVDSGERSVNYIMDSLIGEKYFSVNPNCYMSIISNDWEAMEKYALRTWEINKEQILKRL
jgi:patatin-like phospholipase/acyl hydrolase